MSAQIRRWFDDSQNVNSFLAYRSIPGPIDIDQRVLDAAESDQINGPYDDLVDEGVDRLKGTFERVAAQYDSATTHVLPLSGGLDSRTILGGLLDNVDPGQIITVTFGTPGTWDYRIGQQVADEVGVTNHAIDLTPGSFPWAEQRMVDVASRYDRPTKLFRARSSLEYAFDEVLNLENPVYWSGFMGDAVSGGHLPDSESEAWDEAIEAFRPLNLKCEGLTAPDFDPISVLPDEPALDPSKLSYDDQLDLGVRQPYFIEPAAVFRDNFATPYVEEPYLSFILNVSREYRTDQTLFRDVITSAYPDLFDLPTETMAGLPLSASDRRRKARVGFDLLECKIRRRIGYERVSRRTGHFDWDVELRRSEALQKLVGQQLHDLEARGTVNWLDPDQLYTDHQSGEDLGRQIKMITSLELFLKAEC